MKLLIVTGMSGAGKSQAVNALEDLGYYCVDNIPPALIPSFVDLGKRSHEALSRLAVVTDTRGGELFSEIDSVLAKLKERNIEYQILFLDAVDEELVRRYKENRRKHPLSDDNISIAQAVAKEREMLKILRLCADFIVDTSRFSAAQLKEHLSSIFFGNTNNGFGIQCMSFGFKYGGLNDADLLIDARCLPNPFYDQKLRPFTGLEREVKEYVFASEESKEFAKRFIDFLDYAIPLYSKEGKSRLSIAIGCTGGKHRSVALAEMINKHLCSKGYHSVAVHRDIKK